MDFYLQTGKLLLMMIALSFFIYVFMTPAQLFNNMFMQATDTLHARIEGTVNIDIQNFNNNVSVPGTSVMPLLRDASANGLSLFVQTRAQRGLVVNYGVQLRGPQAQQLAITGFGHTGIGDITGFERNFVIGVNHLFGVSGGDPAGSSMGVESMFNASALDIYSQITGPAANAAFGIDPATFVPTVDPVLTFWDPNSGTYDIASGRGRTYSTTGHLFTPQIRRTNMPTNENVSLAGNQGSPFFVNQSSMFHTTFIVDHTETVVGIYIEEHGVDERSAILAAAMVSEGYITHAVQFNTP